METILRATDAQYRYILKLLLERDYEPFIPLAKQIEIIQKDHQVYNRLTRKAASDFITALTGTARRTSPDKVHQETIDDGFYKVENSVYKVLTSLAGRKYAKRLDDKGNFVYDRGAIRSIIIKGRRLPLDQAQSLGKLYGKCIACGAVLTKKESIELGIGPVCATRFV